MSDEYWLEYHKQQSFEKSQTIEALREEVAALKRETIDYRMQLQAEKMQRDKWRSLALEAKAALSWDQQKVYELKKRFARHAEYYRRAYHTHQKENTLYRATLGEFAHMQSRYMHFFDDVARNAQTVKQCMAVIHHIRNRSKDTLWNVNHE